MRVIVLENYDEVCKKASEIIGDTLKNKKDAFLGLATGSSAEKIYEYLVKEYENKNLDFSECTTVNLDEYVGLSSTHPQSYRKYMDDRFFDKVNIDKSKTYVPVTVGDIKAEILKIRKLIEEKGGTDIQLLGVGGNGHIAFNEPGDRLNASVNIVDLDEETIKANSRFFDNINDVPKQAVSLGIGDILKSKKIVLVACGKEKKNAIKELLTNDYITTKIPCTLLKAHRDVTVIIDKSIADDIQL